MTDKNSIENDKTVKETKSIIEIIQEHRSTFLSLLFGIPIIYGFIYPFITGKLTGVAYYLDSITLVFIFSAMALTLNMEVGYLGLPNFGKVAFIAVGGYSYAITLDILGGKYYEGQIMFLGIPYSKALAIVYALFISIIVTGLFGVVLTLPTLKLREDYFAIVTIVAGEIVRQVLNNQPELGGFIGFSPGNPVYQQYSPRVFMEGLYLTSALMLLILFTIAVAHLIYYKAINNNQEKTITTKKRAIHKSMTIAGVISVIIIFLDYFHKFTEIPSIGLHIAILVLMLSLLLTKSFFTEKINIHLVFLGNYILAILSFIIGNFNPFPESLDDRRIRIFNWAAGTSEIKVVNWFTMIFALFTLLVVYIVIEEIYYSPFGRTLRAIREDDTSAISVGKSIFEFRLRALVIASGLSGLVGAIYAQFLGVITPTTYMPIMTFTLYIMLIIGGTGNNRGVIFGSMIIIMLQRITKGTVFQDANLRYPNGDRIDMVNIGFIFIGVILILFLIYAPEGIFPEIKYNNQRYYDLMKEVENEGKEEDPLLNLLVKLTKSDLETEEWIK